MIEKELLNDSGAITEKIHYYFWNQNAIEQYKVNGTAETLSKQFVYDSSIDDIIQMIAYNADSSIKGTYYYHKDPTGNVIAVTDHTGTVKESVKYDIYGKPEIFNAAGTKVDISEIGNELYMHGLSFENDLYYMRARHYCPETARFLQTDPLGYVDSANLYQGFSMNPTNIIDPMGTIGMDPSTAFFSWQFFLANNKEEVNKAHQLQMQYNSGEVEGHKYSDVGDGNDLFAMATGYSLLDGKEVNFTTTEKVLTVVGIGLPVFGGAALRSFWKFLFADPSNIKKGLNAIENGVEQGKHLDNINFHPAKDPNIIHSTKTDNGLIQITKDEMNHVYGEGYDYKKVFFTENPDLKGKVVVHHGIEQQTLKRYPNLLNETEIHSIDNLRGIPLKLNSDLHLRKIRKEWNNFYRAHPNPTKDQLIQKRLEIDSKYGNLFNPKKVNE
jgi:RHS repeat-associated protein